MHLRVSKKSKGQKTYRYVQLVQSYRREKDGMPAHRVIASLGDLPQEAIDNLRAALKASRRGSRVVVDPHAAIALPTRPVQANLRYLDHAVCLALWNRWGLSDILGELFGDEGPAVPSADIVAALTLQRCIDPGSKLAAQRWFPRTALPELLALPPGRFNNTRIHRALAALETIGEPLQGMLARRYAAQDGAYRVLFLDVTDTWFVGYGPELAQQGKTKEGMIRRKIGLVLLCDQRGYPIRWTVIPGKRPDGKAMLDMISEIAKLGWAADTPLVCDRAMGKACYVETLLRSGLQFLTAIPVTEFGTYTDRVPHQALAAVEVQDRDDADKDSMEAAVAAIRASGMREISEKLFVLELGQLHPFGQPDNTDDGEPLPLPDIEAAASSAAAELRFGLRMKEDLDQGRAKSFGHLGLLYGCHKARAAQLVYLTELNVETQQVILDGRAEQVSQRALLRIRLLPDPEQSGALEAAIEAAAQPGTRAKRRKAAGGKKTKNRVRGPAADPVRGVLYFNPDVFVRKRRTALRRLAAVEEACHDLNRRLATPQSRRTKHSILGEIGRLLRPNNFLGVYEPILTTYEADGRTRFRVELRLNEEAWNERRRHDGFSLLIGHGDLQQSPEALVQLYRDKDQVEKDFQLIKSPIIAIRPVWHRTDPKMRAHVTLCMLALLLHRTLERLLADAGAHQTAARALEELATCHLNQLALGGSPEPVYTITHLTDAQSQIVGALKMTELADDQEIAGAISPR